MAGKRPSALRDLKGIDQSFYLSGSRLIYQRKSPHLGRFPGGRADAKRQSSAERRSGLIWSIFALLSRAAFL